VAGWAGVEASELPAEDLISWIVDRPLQVGDVTAPRRLVAADRGAATEVVDFVNPWGRGADALLARVRDGGPGVVVLSGAPDRSALLDRIQVAERLRLEQDRPVAVTAATEDVPDLAAALVAGRIDLAYLAE
jgi:anthraniloyl-CoA monooxygenase